MEPRRATAPTLSVNGFVVADNKWCDFCSHLHEHAWPFLAVVLSGGIEKDLGRLEFDIPASSAYVMPAEVPHRDRFPHGTRIVTLEIDPSSDIAERCVRLLARIRRLRGPSFGSLARELATELHGQKDDMTSLAVEGLALELVASALRSVEHAEEQPRPPAWLSTVDEYLAAQYLGRIRIEELGTLVHVHPAHLARVFRTHHGETIGRRIRRLRLEWAKGKLVESDVPLREIAVSAGFAHQSHFTRVFKAATGSSPARYRELRRAGSN
ncbi:MAG TPA: AraC family transcriptional regulator [Gaiellaceae bacterium]|nr:AraC family transcriptional regulator [Gaiellaceae bacterium]